MGGGGGGGGGYDELFPLNVPDLLIIFLIVQRIHEDNDHYRTSCTCTTHSIRH